MVVERRADAVEPRRIEAELVVVVLDRAEPEAHHVDSGGLRAKLALAGDLGLLEIDAAVGLRSFQGGNMVDAGEA
jgi:hypothetical protein